MCLLSDTICIENFYPITIGIFDECQSFHSTFIWFLNECNTHLVKAFASRIHVWNHDTDVAKTARLWIAIVILLVWIRFRTPVAVNRMLLIYYDNIDYKRTLLTMWQFMTNNLLCKFNGCLAWHCPSCAFGIWAGWHIGRIFIAQKVQRKFRFRKVQFLQQCHAQYTSVKWQRCSRIFDTIHCLLEKKILKNDAITIIWMQMSFEWITN